MKKELLEIKSLSDNLEYKLNNKKPTNLEIKNIKNDIFGKTSKIFIYNLKKLIQIEETQKNLAKIIGVSPDLLSKYKSGETFPTIETLIYICEVYKLSLDNLLNKPLNAIDIENLENSLYQDESIFLEKYYLYFSVTNLGAKGSIHKGILEIKDNIAIFKIVASDRILKYFKGNFSVSENILSFNLESSSDGNVSISMIKPPLNKNKYLGGIGFLMLPSDASSKPCIQKIILSNKNIDREVYFNDLKDILKFSVLEKDFNYLKLNQEENDIVYNFISKL
ncbi:MAG: helix-turn-helix domain-containing protein [Clostridium sp.]